MPAKVYTGTDKKFALFTMLSLHIQLIIGLGLYFISPAVEAALADPQKMVNSVSRFWAVEHITGMIIAIAVATYGYMRSKKRPSDWARHRVIFFTYLLALIIILATVPWPFREVGAGRGWF
ncbi:MAG: hypothetical protein JNM00_14730 [Flavobacteriales bacterium]|nr:hypothetical protein [Flavobacteriales bacterium]